ncbi:MAG: sigma-54-dependent transcriptional regulator [Desulfovibrionaceae bacterium]
MKRLLVIDDEPGHRLMVRAVMEDEGWEVFEAGSGELGLAFLEDHETDVVLLDMRMPGMDGQEVLARLQAEEPSLPVVMLTAFGTVGTAVEAMKRGAFDYLTKPADNEELSAVLEKAYEFGRLLRENANLKRRIATGESGSRIIGDSAAMRRVMDMVEQAGPSEATVLVLGESGTGKELVADALHRASLRSDKPIIKVNCAALPGNLLESELFGYVKGAFTGAVKDKPGRFQLAHGGTLFLDEVGELPMELQAKLLRVLQERIVEPLGGVRSVPVDVRIIAASNRNLADEVASGGFREDLYFRLNVLEILMPPLRERKEDLPQLISYLLDKLSRKNRKGVRSVSSEYLTCLARHDWPGNVRELENVLERSIILSRSDTIGPETLPPQFGAGVGAGAGRGGAAEHAAISPGVLEEAEKDALRRALEAHGGHRERTADALGVSRRTLQYKLRKYGLTKR